MLENVRNLLDMDDGETFREVIPELDSPHFEGNSVRRELSNDPLPVDR